MKSFGGVPAFRRFFLDGDYFLEKLTNVARASAYSLGFFVDRDA